jgi:hypothetical protein
MRDPKYGYNHPGGDSGSAITKILLFACLIAIILFVCFTVYLK